MIHTNLPQNLFVFLLLCKLTQSVLYGSQTFDCHKWPIEVVDEVMGKPCNFEWYLCGSLYSTFKNVYMYFCHMHFITNAYKRSSKTNWYDPRQRVPLSRFSKHQMTLMKCLMLYLSFLIQISFFLLQHKSAATTLMYKQDLESSNFLTNRVYCLKHWAYRFFLDPEMGL